MKEGVWVQDIVANRSVAGIFLAKEKKLLFGKTGKAYLLLKIMDRTGEIEARIWDRVEDLSGRFQAGDLIHVSGDSVAYQGSVQVKVKDLGRGVAPQHGDFVEFVPGYLDALRLSEERLEELLALVESVRSAPLRALGMEILHDPALKEGWISAPAAKALHHARFGGLLEHTLSVCKLAVSICDHYPVLRRDLLLLGAILHDVGKIRELHAPWRPDYTTEGRLLGHVVMGLQMLEERIAGIEGFPEQEAMELKHLLLSHHGHLEYGSPKRPKTLEALVLFMLDDLDAKFDTFSSHLNSHHGSPEDWTSYHTLLERYIYRGRPQSPPAELAAPERSEEPA